MQTGPSVQLNDPLFPVELMEMTNWTSMSEHNVTFEFRTILVKCHRREFWCIYLYIAAFHIS